MFVNSPGDRVSIPGSQTNDSKKKKKKKMVLDASSFNTQLYKV